MRPQPAESRANLRRMVNICHLSLFDHRSTHRLVTGSPITLRPPECGPAGAFPARTSLPNQGLRDGLPAADLVGKAMSLRQRRWFPSLSFSEDDCTECSTSTARPSGSGLPLPLDGCPVRAIESLFADGFSENSKTESAWKTNPCRWHARRPRL
ncbi:hypothetical protein AHiyo1_42270 [Arthrobacter sp. Hiyo1]|nr:hypothetical protein AHiyo1_42270 [Arthrobacter sp. Hiyo1]